jgi:hypothetical protein
LKPDIFVARRTTNHVLTDAKPGTEGRNRGAFGVSESRAKETVDPLVCIALPVPDGASDPERAIP